MTTTDVTITGNAKVFSVQGGGREAQTGQPAGELPKAELPKAVPEDVKQIVSNWNGILSQLTGLTKNYLKKGLPSLGPGDSLLLVYDDKNAYSYISENRSNCQEEFKGIIAERLGKEVELLVKLNDTGQPSGEVYPDLRQLIDFDIEEEDF